MIKTKKSQRKRWFFLAGIFGIVFLIICLHLTASLRNHGNSEEERSRQDLATAIERLQQQNALLEAQVQCLREMAEKDNQNELSEHQPKQDSEDTQITSSGSAKEGQNTIDADAEFKEK